MGLLRTNLELLHEDALRLPDGGEPSARYELILWASARLGLFHATIDLCGAGVDKGPYARYHGGGVRHPGHPSGRETLPAFGVEGIRLGPLALALFGRLRSVWEALPEQDRTRDRSCFHVPAPVIPLHPASQSEPGWLGQAHGRSGWAVEESVLKTTGEGPSW